MADSCPLTEKRRKRRGRSVYIYIYIYPGSDPDVTSGPRSHVSQNRPLISGEKEGEEEVEGGEESQEAEFYSMLGRPRSSVSLNIFLHGHVKKVQKRGKIKN